jgi:hypothetical protein
VTPDDETELITVIQDLPLREAQYKQYTAKRRRRALRLQQRRADARWTHS